MRIAGVFDGVVVAGCLQRWRGQRSQAIVDGLGATVRRCRRELELVDGATVAVSGVAGCEGHRVVAGAQCRRCGCLLHWDVGNMV